MNSANTNERDALAASASPPNRQALTDGLIIPENAKYYAAKRSINALLNGRAPNGVSEAELGEWWATYSELLQGYDSGGTAGVKQVWETYCAQYPDLKPMTARYTFQMETLDEIMLLPEKPWIIQNVLGEGDTAMIFGESESGKTFMAFNLMMTLARGHGHFAGKFEVKRPANVVYMTAEGRAGLGQRTRAATQSFELTEAEKARVMVIRDVVDFVDSSAPRYYANLLNDISAQNFTPDVIFIDHLSSTVPGKGDSDQGAATLVAQAVAHIQSALGCAVVFIHHTGYDKSHARGMTNYKDIMDMMLQVEMGNPRKLACVKNKDGEKWNSLDFTLNQVGETNSCTVIWMGESATEEPGARYSPAERYVLRYLREHNATELQTVTASADVCSAASARKAIYSLADKGLVERADGGGAGSKATYSLTGTGLETCINL